MSEINQDKSRQSTTQLTDILYKSPKGDHSAHPLRPSDPKVRFRQAFKTWTGGSQIKIALAPLASLMLFSACLPANDVSKMPVRQSDKAPISINGEVGALAAPLLEQEKMTSLTLEIQPMGATQLSQEALNHVKDFLVRELAWTNDQVSITVNPSISNYEDPYSGSGRMSLRWAREIEKRIRKRRPTGKQGALFVLISDAHSVDQTETARPFGLAHRSTSVILYHPAISDASGGDGQPQRWRLEAAVLEHELGHLLGLVNTAPTKASSDIHQDPKTDITEPHEANDSPTHCANPSCLMNASTLVALSLAPGRTADQMPELCEKCREALSGLRGR